MLIMLVCMALLSCRLFCKNLGNLQEFFWQMDYRPPPGKKLPVRLCRKIPKISPSTEKPLDMMIARATLDKKYTALYNFPLYYLSSDRLRELRKKKQISNF